VELTPESLRGTLDGDHFKLYKLIWDRFIACQMSPARYDTVAADLECGGWLFRANGRTLRFPGYTALYVESADGDAETDSALPPLSEGEALINLGPKTAQKFTQPPARYNEASLIRAMEEKNIGRPSTYAPTVSTILDREYVVKENKSLRPTALGETVTGFMEERFGDIVDLAFTAHMEATLDEVEKGEKPWKQVLRDFYGGFSHSLEDAEVNLKGTRIKVPDEVTSEICPNCGKNLVVKFGRFGRFLACPGYPECSFTMPIVEVMPGRCPKCSSRILKRKSKKGYTYYACEHGQECGFMTWDVPTKDDCPVCGQTLFKRSGRGYRKPFCVNPECSAFVPEDQRGYKKKTEKAESGEAAAAGTGETAGAKAASKKPAAKKTAAKKPAAKKTGTKKTTEKKTAGRTGASRKKSAGEQDG
jgi:DNA topoisomerase-1